MIGTPLNAYPSITNRGHDDNPIFQSIAATLENCPIYVQDIAKTTEILDFLRLSKKPSAMAQLQESELFDVVRIVDDIYVLYLESYRESLQSAIELDELSYQNWNPSARELMIAEIYRMTHFENNNSWLPKKISLLFWGVWGAFVGCLDPTLETRAALRLSSASEHRRMWLHQVEILELKRVQQSQSLLHLRLSPLKQEIVDLEEAGLQDFSLDREKNQLETILNLFSTAAPIQPVLQERSVTPYNSLTRKLRPIDCYCVFLSSLIISSFVYYILPQNSVAVNVTVPGYIYSNSYDAKTLGNTYRTIAAIAVLVLMNTLPLIDPSLYIRVRSQFFPLQK